MPSLLKNFFLPALFLLTFLAGCFIYYHYCKEREVAEIYMQESLCNVNEGVYDLLRIRGASSYSADIEPYLQRYIVHNGQKGLRLTLISAGNGEVLYESAASEGAELPNHGDRPEFIQALEKGAGCDVRRLSGTLGREFFYVAVYDSQYDFVVRSSLPYEQVYVYPTYKHLLVLIVSAVLLLTLAIIMYKAMRVAGNNELATQKLLMHLRISQEGLAFFDSRKRLIFSNPLFDKYCDFISVVHMDETAGVLDQPEFRAIKRFIDSGGYLNSDVKQETYSHRTEVSGHVFLLRCVLFNDNSFEVSVNDVSIKERQQKLEKQLAQNVAHELKTPVTSIQGYLETIIDNYPENITPEQLMRFLQRCQSQSNRLHNLVRDIQNLDNFGDTGQEMEKLPLDVADVVAGIQQEVNDKVIEQGMTVENNLPPRMPLVGDQGKIYSIFRNLFDNAITYAGEGAKISLKCYRTDSEYYYLSFADNGVGVPVTHLPHLFERFYRVDKGRSRKLGGTGLGLAIVKNAVILHGGTISARSAAGGGLEFVFKLKIQA